MSPLDPATLVAFGRAAALVHMRDLVESWPNPAMEMPFGEFGLRERLSAVAAFHKEAMRQTKIMDGLTVSMVKSYMNAMRQEWLEPQMLERWTSVGYLAEMLDVFKTIPGEGESLEKAWKMGVNRTSQNGSMIGSLCLLAQLPPEKARSLASRYWFDADVGAPYVLHTTLKHAIEAGADTAAGMAMENPARQKSLCDAWLLLARMEGEYLQTDDRRTGARIWLVAASGRLLSVCPDLMHQTLGQEGVPLSWLGALPVDDNNDSYELAGNAKIKSMGLLAMSGRPNTSSKNQSRKF